MGEGLDKVVDCKPGPVALHASSQAFLPKLKARLERAPGNPYHGVPGGQVQMAVEANGPGCAEVLNLTET